MEIDFLRDSKASLHRKLVKTGLVRFATILILECLELQEILEISEQEVEELKQLILAKINLKERLGNVPDTRLTTGCNQIDALLWGGLPTVRTLEVFGCAGSGKTQFCLQLLITSQLPIDLGGLNKKAVYICTEPPFPAKRFHQMCTLAPQRFNVEKDDFESNVFIHTCYNNEELLKCCNETLPKLMANVPVGLIIIDTIAAVFRGDDQVQEPNYRKRSLQFREIVEKLRLLAMAHDAAIICVNQVTDNPNTNQTYAALGPSWSALVAQSFQISRVDANSSTRKFSIIRSYESAPKSVEFHIKEEGIV